MSAGDEFHPVTRSQPCVICEKPDWCRRTTDGAYECHRINEPMVNGYKRIKVTAAGFTVYRHPDDLKDRENGKPTRHKAGTEPESIDLADEDRRFRAAVTVDEKALIARDLGVGVAALESIGIGRAESDDLRRLRAGGRDWLRASPVVVSSFPERNAAGAVIGFCFRADDGRKGSPSGKVGAKRGLIIPRTLPVRPDPVLIVEGATDTAACETLGLAAVGRPSNSSGANLLAPLLSGRQAIVLGENDRNPAGVWPGREGARKVAKGLAGKWKTPVRWSLPPGDSKDVRSYLQDLIKKGLDVADENACKEAGRAFLAEIIATSIEEEPPADTSRGGKGEGATRDALLHLCVQADDHFFHDNENVAYVAVYQRGVTKTMEVKSRQYKLLLSKRYYDAFESGIPSTALSEAIATLEALAIHRGPMEEVFIRIGERDGTVVLDLCDDQWRVVVIDENGWRVTKDSPVRFRRTRGMLPLPVPVEGGSINDLRPFLNVASDDQFILICAFLIGCFNPQGPFAVLLVNGEQGSAKSTLSRMLRALVDPNKAPLRSTPKDNRDLAIAARNAWMIGLDNMSRLSEWLSNGMCRLATGGGFATRELYTDTDETIFDAKRPILINGIGDVVDRSDLLDRSIRLTLPTISEDSRRSERSIWPKFEEALPAILGAILDAVSCAIRHRDSVTFERLPRMADFASWVVAAEGACPWESGAFLRALDEQRSDADLLIIESSPLASAILDRLDSHGDIVGTATEILETLSHDRDERCLKDRHWPKSPSALGSRLRELGPILRRQGVLAEFDRDGKRRQIVIRRVDRSIGTPIEAPPVDRESEEERDELLDFIANQDAASDDSDDGDDDGDAHDDVTDIPF